MSRLSWNDTGSRLYTTGCDKGVLFVMDEDGSYKPGVAWNGLTSVNEAPEGGDANDIYADNIKYLSLRAAEEYGATVNAFYSPEEFDICDGTLEIAPGLKIKQQARRAFAFAYRTYVGNDVMNTDYGYTIHIIYNCTASPSDREYNTVNENPDASELSWEFKANKVNVPDAEPTAVFEINSKTAGEAKMKALEDKLYGTDNSEPTLPTVQELINMFKVA